jgi:signal transduction histidine kinase
VLGTEREIDAERRLARLLALQESLVEASRALGVGASLGSVLGSVLDRVTEQGRGFRAIVVDHVSDEPTVLARYPEGTALPDPGLGRVERDFARDLLGTAEIVDRPAEAAPPAAGPLPSTPHLLGVRLEVSGSPRGALVFATDDDDGLDQDDRFVLQGLTTVVSAALTALRRAQEQRELERLRSDFISRVSHELRTPLTIISGFAGTLAAHDETLQPGQRHEMLDRIITASVRLEHLVDDVLSLASVEAGTREPSPVSVPVRDVIDLVVHDQGGDGRVHVSCPSDLRVCTDPSLARQTLGPIVQNALQHGERIDVVASGSPAGVRIAVSDDGPGIPEELGDRVFDRFVRGDDRSPGMGLGLAVARSAGTAIGAELRWEPSSAGARFVLLLPDLVVR